MELKEHIDKSTLKVQLDELRKKVGEDLPLIVLVGKSGAGKNAVQNWMVENLRFNPVVSHTTRPMRAGESEGEPYHFVSQKEFDTMLLTGKFLEHTEYRNWCYGISNAEISGKKNPVVVTDAVGVRNIQRAGIKHISFYISRIDKYRFISAIERGDDIMEIALRNERDKACYQDISHIVDYTVSNNGDIVDCVVEILEDVYDWLEEDKRFQW